MRRSLVCKHFWDEISLDKLWQDIGTVCNKANGNSPSFFLCLFGHCNSFIKTVGFTVKITFIDALVYHSLVNVNNEADTLVHGHSKWLGTTHLPASTSHRYCTLECPTKVFLGNSGKGIVCALQYSLGTYVNP